MPCYPRTDCTAYKNITSDAKDAQAFYQQKYHIIETTPWIKHNLKLMQANSYRRLRKYCTCCHCSHHCQPCFTPLIRTDMITLLLELIHYEQNFDIRIILQQEVAEIRRSALNLLRPRTP